MWLNIIGLLVAFACSMIAAPLAAKAQVPAKVPRIGILSPAAEASTPGFAAFRQGLRALGYIEGQNIVLEFRLAAGRAERLRELAAELVALKVEVILTDSTAAAHVAKQATTTLPIVMATSGDPVQSGLVASLARPEGNITGLTLRAPELSGKRLELLKEAIPGVTQVAVLWNPRNPAAANVRETEVAAQSLHLRLHLVEVPGAEALEAAFGAAVQGRADALLTLPDAMLWNQRLQVVGLAAKHRLPAMFPEREFVDAGGLLSYGPSVPANFQRAATYVAKDHETKPLGSSILTESSDYPRRLFMQLTDFARQLPEEVWELCQPLLSPVVWWGHGRPPASNYDCVQAVFSVLVSGIGGRMLPRGCPSYKTVQRRLKVWRQRDTVRTAWQQLAQRYEALHGITWDQILLDGAQKPAKQGANRRGRVQWSVVNVAPPCTERVTPAPCHWGPW